IYDTDPAFETFKKNPDHAELQVGLPYFALFSYDGSLYWEGTEYDAVDTFDKVIGEALKK
ncbi:MAG: protein-disulfide reductase, partial [Nitrospinota bacterium]